MGNVHNENTEKKSYTGCNKRENNLRVAIINCLDFLAFAFLNELFLSEDLTLIHRPIFLFKKKEKI